MRLVESGRMSFIHESLYSARAECPLWIRSLLRHDHYPSGPTRIRVDGWRGNGMYRASGGLTKTGFLPADSMTQIRYHAHDDPPSRLESL